MAACLMPSHFHLLCEVAEPRVERIRLSRVVAAFSRRFGARRIWDRVPEPSRVPDRKYLQRTVRYVLLNPCRSRLVDDPLCWRFSTLRGSIGAEHDPWVPASRLAAELGRAGNFERWLHAYVSRDPDAALRARSFPSPAIACDVPRIPLADILAAALAATPWSSVSVRRHAFVLLALAQGWRDTALLAEASGLGRSQIYRLSRQPDAPLLAAAALCLGDPRLRDVPRR